MYVPPPFQAPDRESVLDLIEAAPFATLVSFGAEPWVSHLPLALTRRSGAWGSLAGHVARANPHAERFDGRQQALAVFHGPHAYVSPGWYADPEAPPTWNYAVVHAYGRPRRVDDPARRGGLLDALVARYEEAPLALTGPARRALERAIVAFEFEIERVEAKFKLGQNRSPADRAGTLDALERGGEVERELAAWTRRLASPSGAAG